MHMPSDVITLTKTFLLQEWPTHGITPENPSAATLAWHSGNTTLSGHMPFQRLYTICRQESTSTLPRLLIIQCLDCGTNPPRHTRSLRLKAYSVDLHDKGLHGAVNIRLDGTHSEAGFHPVQPASGNTSPLFALLRIGDLFISPRE